MIFELHQLNNMKNSDYEKYVFTMSVDELLLTSHSSNIQRFRNPDKEKGIMKFIKGNLDEKKVPFFQSFILHYNGKIDVNENGKFLLDPQKQFPVEIMNAEGQLEHKLVEFEVIDGNGRLNSFIRLQQLYIDKVVELKSELRDLEKEHDAELAKDKKEQDEVKIKALEKRIKRMSKKVNDTMNKNQSLSNMKLTIELYVNLSDKQKTELFKNVNQNEPMSQGRLELYDDSKPENKLLHDYILHTQALGDKFPYTITVDKDTVRTAKEKEHYLPSVYLLPDMKKVIKYYDKKDISEYQDEIFEAFDNYITQVPNHRMLRKQFFSILGTVIDTASKYEGKLPEFTSKMAHFDCEAWDDVSKKPKLVRNEVIKFTFKDAIEKVAVANNSERPNNIINIDELESKKNLDEVALTKEDNK